MKKVFILLILLSPLWAANEIQFPYNSDNSIYAVTRDVNGLIWNRKDTGWQTWADANISDYNIPLTDKGGDDYSANFPTGIVTAGIYSVNIYFLAGSSPAITDTLIGGGEISWNGSAEITQYRIATDSNKAAVDANTAATGLNVWSVGTRTLTAGTNIALAKGTGVTGFNDVNTQDINETITANPTIAAVPTAAQNASEVMNDPNFITAKSDITIIKDQVSDPNDNTTIAGRMADLWLNSGSGGFSD